PVCEADEEEVGNPLAEGPLVFEPVRVRGVDMTDPTHRILGPTTRSGVPCRQRRRELVRSLEDRKRGLLFLAPRVVVPRSILAQSAVERTHEARQRIPN